MRPGFDLDGGAAAATGGAFFMCTETSPRCFVIKQVSDVDGALKEVQQQSSSTDRPATSGAMLGTEEAQASSSSTSPYLPMLPWWFTAECRQQLLAIPAPEELHNRALTPETRPPSSIGPALPLSQEQLRARLTRQLEYYFSRENLINDRYLRCQMDADQYVPIKIVANFPKVAQLTTDFGLIVEVLKTSSQVQVDETGTKVRPMSKRCTIILREIPQNANENEVKAMFQGDGCPPYQSLAYGLNDSWYVTFHTEEDTQQAFFHLQTLGKTFNGKPVFARIKTGGAPIGADLHHRHSPDGQIRLDGGNLRGQLIIHDPSLASTAERATPSPLQNGVANEQLKQLHGEHGSSPASSFELGRLLALFGYVPRATFRPHIPVPTAPVMPQLQPTSAGSTVNGLPQPPSYFAQPILHNGLDHHHQLHRLHRHFLPQHGHLHPQHHLPFMPNFARRPSRPLPITVPDEPEEQPDYEEEDEEENEEERLQRLGQAEPDHGADQEPDHEADCALVNGESGGDWESAEGSGGRREEADEEEAEDEADEDEDGTECAEEDGEREEFVNGSGADFVDCSDGEDEEEEEDGTGTHSTPSSAVGQNEFVLRQRAREQGGIGTSSPVLVPKEVPRITDCPRINGKGAHRPSAQSSDQQQRAGTKSGRHSPPLASGGGFVGFQRQESVEAYQMAVAANGVTKKSRVAKLDREEKSIESVAPAGRLNKAVGTGGKAGLPRSATLTGRTNSSDQPPPRILGSHGPRRSEPAAPHPPPLRPLNDSSVSGNWRQPSSAQANKQQQSPPTTTSVSTSTTTTNPVFIDFHGRVPAWQGGPGMMQNLSGIQPLLSLGQIQPVGHQQQQQHVQQQQYVQQQQQQHVQHIQQQQQHSMHQQPQQQQQMAPLNAQHRGGSNYEGRKPIGRDHQPFRGGGGGNGPGYRPRTWTSDWSRGGGQTGGYQGGEGGGGRGGYGQGGQGAGHFQPQREGRGGGQFQWHGRGGGQMGGRGGGGLPRGKRSVESGSHELEENKPPVQAQQQQMNHVQAESQQRGEHRHFGAPSQQRPPPPPPHFGGPPAHHFRHEQRQRSNTTAGQPPPHRFHRESSGSDNNGPSAGAASQQQQGGQQKVLLKAGEKPAGYNFEEHVEEFPALSLSRSSSRKASECHGEQQQCPLLTVDEPEKQPVVANGTIGNIGTACPGEHKKVAFSAVVASGRPRRATIGTTAFGGVAAIKLALKEEEAGEGAGNLEEEELLLAEEKQPRSGTVSAGMIVPLVSPSSGGGRPRSYAQMLKSGPPKSSSSAKDGSSCSASLAGTEI